MPCGREGALSISDLYVQNVHLAKHAASAWVRDPLAPISSCELRVFDGLLVLPSPPTTLLAHASMLTSEC